MRVFLALFLFVLGQITETETHSLDLEAMLDDTAALRKLTVVYRDSIAQNGWIHRFFIRGDGSLILQAIPERPLAVTDVPTCRAHVGQDVTRDLVRTIIKNRFLGLPERFYLSASTAQVTKKLELHTIVIDDGKAKTSRTFGVGMFNGKTEAVPADFLAIEAEMKRLRDSVFPPGAKPCHFALAIKL